MLRRNEEYQGEPCIIESHTCASDLEYWICLERVGVGNLGTVAETSARRRENLDGVRSRDSVVNIRKMVSETSRLMQNARNGVG